MMIDDTRASHFKMPLLAAVAVFSVWGGSSASASSLPTPYIDTSSGLGAGTFTINCSAAPGSCTEAYSASYANGVAAVTASVTQNSPGGGGLVTPGAQIGYYFEVLGPSSVPQGTMVTLDITQTLLTSFSGQGYALAISGSGGSIAPNAFVACSSSGGVYTNYCSTTWGTTNSSVSGTVTFTAQVGTPAVWDVSAGCYSLPDSNCSASVDPSITIDPSLAGQGYSIIYSPNAVPLPTTIWLVGSGLLGLVSLGRRKAQSFVRQPA